LIFFEPITFDNKIPVGFSHPPGGHRFANKSVLAYHYYAPPALGLGTIDSRIADAKRLGIPSFLTEYLGTNIDILDRAQKNQQSWLYW
jgi:endoglycosylceramidase